MGSKSTFFVVRVSRGCHNFLPQSGTLDKVFHSRVQCIPWESEANVSRSQSADKKKNISNTNEGGIKSPWFMDVKIAMQVDCWKRCYCGLTLTANDKGCIPSIQHRWTMAPYHATRFFFQFPELIVGFMSTLRLFLAIARTMEPLFQGGVCRAFNTPTDPEKSQAREMAKIIRLLSCLIIIIMIIIIIIITIIILYWNIAISIGIQ